MIGGVGRPHKADSDVSNLIIRFSDRILDITRGQDHCNTTPLLSTICTHGKVVNISECTQMIIAERALFQGYQRATGIPRIAILVRQIGRLLITYKFSNVSQSLRVTTAADPSKSVGSLGSKVRRSCEQRNGELSIASGRAYSDGRDSHRSHDRTNCAGTTAQGTFSRSRVLPFSALSCICFSLACHRNVVLNNIACGAKDD
jgi:hypothetical protein